MVLGIDVRFGRDAELGGRIRELTENRLAADDDELVGGLAYLLVELLLLMNDTGRSRQRRQTGALARPDPGIEQRHRLALWFLGPGSRSEPRS
ncbi:MAG: hypothetical protein JW940_22310 [Polyangiaceae bacterium]|nr:hypothetical protein [Polyangiaceae bacterium]